MPVTKPTWDGPIGPHLVGPEWQWAWRDLRFALPLQAGPFSDLYAADAKAVESVGSNVTAPTGTDGLTVRGATGLTARTTANQIVVADSEANNQPTPPVTFAAVVSDVVGVAGTSEYQSIASWGGIFFTGGFTAYDFGLYHRAVSNTFRVFLFNRNTSTLAGGDSDALMGFSGFWASSGGPYLVVARWNADDTIDFWIQGIKQTTKTSTNPYQTGSSTADLRLLHAPQATSAEYDFTGKLHAFYMWGRGLSDREVQLLTSDPYGPIRPRLWGPELVATGTAHTRTIFSTATSTLVDS